MQKFATLADAVALAEFAHRNQVDKAGFPYIEHPRRVMATVQAMGGMPFVQIAAILHDVTEDTAVTPAMLKELGFSEAAVQLIELVDRNEAEFNYNRRVYGGYDLYGAADEKEFYYKAIAQDPNAVMIKRADIQDNLSPYRLSYLTPGTQERLKDKYAKALAILEGTP